MAWHRRSDASGWRSAGAEVKPRALNRKPLTLKRKEPKHANRHKAAIAVMCSNLAIPLLAQTPPLEKGYDFDGSGIDKEAEFPTRPARLLYELVGFLAS